MKEQLELIGCSVDVLPNGVQALRQLELKAYYVLLTDVDVPIIGVTANALREEGEQCIRVGTNN